MTTSRSEFAADLEGDSEQGPQQASRDDELVALFWSSFDQVLTGLKERKLTDLLIGKDIAALTATLYIQRAKG